MTTNISENLYKSTVNINGEKLQVIYYNHISEQQDKKEKNQVHHIHILDRSGSMSWSIKELIENVKATIDLVDKNDLISILWFSSPGEYRTLIKGASPNEAIKKLLDSINFTLGTTCFSEVLKETEEIITELKPLCENISITLFTDGQPVTNWSSDEEKNRCYDIIDRFKDSIIALNTVGYGNYYDKDFLVNMANKSSYGQYIHSKNIQEYLNIFSHNYSKVSELNNEKLELKSVENYNHHENYYVTKKDSNILYVNESFNTLSKDGYLVLNNLSSDRNNIFFINTSDMEIIIPKQTEHDFYQYVCGDNNMFKINKEIPEDILLDFYYNYASRLYYNGNRKLALRILSENVKDKYLVEEQMKAFTFDECAEYQAKLDAACFDTSKRYLNGKCEDNYLPKKDAFCVMDLFRLLQDSENCYYVPFSKNVEQYKRIGIKTESEMENLFSYKDEEVLIPFSDFVFNESELNLSIRMRIDGTTKINLIAAKRVGLEKEQESHIFRNHTLIKNGELNIKQIEALVPLLVLNSVPLINHCVLFRSPLLNYPDILKKDNIEYFRIIIDLTKLPIINDLYLEKSNDVENIYTKAKQLEFFKARQKVLNYFISKAEESNIANIKTNKFKDFNKEQIQVLQEHGLNDNFTYNPVGYVAKSDEVKANLDFYIAKGISFDIKGLSSLPSITDAIKSYYKNTNSKKPLTLANRIIIENYKDILLLVSDEFKEVMRDISKTLDDSGSIDEKIVAEIEDLISLEPSKYPKKLYNILVDELKNVKKEIIEIRYELAGIKLAKVLNNDWWVGLEYSKEKGIDTYSYKKDDGVLVIKVKENKHYFEA